MQPAGTNIIAKKIAWCEGLSFLFVIALIWFDELLDIPHVLLGGEATPINWRESTFESLAIAVVGILIIRHTYKLLVRVSYLESILPVCPSCKKIRIDPEFWQGIEEFVEERARKEFVHGVCPECIHKYYPELSGKHSSQSTSS